LRLHLWTVLISIAAISLLSGAYGATELDNYFNLRRQHQAMSLKISEIKTNPEAYKGKVFELRGKLSGTARGGEQTLFIIDCGDGCYVVNADPDSFPNLSAGSRICILAEVGENCTIALSDLRLVALAYESDVLLREQKAMEAEAARKAKEIAKQQQKEAQAKLDAQRKQAQQKQAAQPMAAEQMVAAYKNAIKSYNKKLSDAEADTIARSILAFGAKYEVDPRLVVAIILAESNFRPDATSPKGAMGLGQLMPGTAAGLGVSNAYDPVQNIQGSVRLIRGHLDKLTGSADWSELTWHDLALALASYNAGPGAVKKYGGVPPYRETEQYISKVFSIYKKLCGIEN
jgi:soluble lytic murein transglycosylase-like protein